MDIERCIRKVKQSILEMGLERATLLIKDSTLKWILRDRQRYG